MNTTAWTFFQILWPLLLAGLVWIAAKFSQLLSIKARNERLIGALLRVDIVAVTATRAVQQVLVDRLEAASGDGTLTPEQRTAAKQAAIDSAKAQLGARGLAELRDAFGLDAAEVDVLLATRIEAAVHHEARKRRKALRRRWDSGTAGDAVPFAA
jgi:hypothetical protein